MSRKDNPRFLYQQSGTYRLLHDRLNRVSWLSPLVNQAALSLLSRQLQKNNPFAASVIAVSLQVNPIPGIQKRIETTLRTWFSVQDNHGKDKAVQGCLNVIWETWYGTRSPNLADILVEYQLPASNPVSLKCLSLLVLGNIETLQNATPGMIPGLVAVLDETIGPFAEQANLILQKLKKKGSVDALCAIWDTERNSQLETILLQANYTAKKPHELRLLTTLLHTSDGVEALLKPDDIPWLLQRLDDPNPSIRSHTREVLEKLENSDLQNIVCLQLLHSPDDRLEEILVQSGCAPQKQEDKILFYFLTAQWNKYEELDFDQRILKSIYPLITEEQRLRLTRKIQTNGKMEYLHVLTDWSNPYAQNNVSQSESEMLVRMLAENHDYDKLWDQITGFYPKVSLRAMQILMDNQWQPEKPDERFLFNELAEIISHPIQLAFDAMKKTIPFAIPQARVNFKGRINDICFHPRQNIIAIGSGIRKVILWNYETASPVTVLDGFEHSISKTIYLPDGTLVIGERTNRNSPCGIYTWDSHHAQRIGMHGASITSIIPMGPQHFISCGRDQQIIQWRLNSPFPPVNTNLPVWARAACLSPDHQFLMIFDEYPYRFDLNTGDYKFQVYTRKNRKISNSMVRSAVFAPDGTSFITGHYNGQLARFEFNPKQDVLSKFLISHYPAPVQEVHFLPGESILVSGLGNGTIHFLEGPDYPSLANVKHPEGKLTSLYISPDGKFMASGTSEYTMVLWDLRTREISEVFNQPLSLARPDHLGTLLSLFESNYLPAYIKNGLKFTHRLLQHRFLYDVEIAESHTIQPGEFDIIVD